MGFTDYSNKIDPPRIDLGGQKVKSTPDTFEGEISGSPLTSGGYDGIYELRVNLQGNLEFHSSSGSKVYAGTFIVFGFLFGFWISLHSDLNDLGSFSVFLLPLLCFCIGYGLYQWLSMSIVFDKQNGYFYKGKPKMLYGLVDPTDTHVVPLNSIHAIQITAQTIHGETTYISYEINFVLNNKTRVNVVGHGDREKIQADSKQLGEYLGVPIWGL